jgi:hypothetical protein
MPTALATWESVERLRLQFPRVPAWGQAVSQDRGNVSTPEAPVPEVPRKEPEQAETSVVALLHND